MPVAGAFVSVMINYSFSLSCLLVGVDKPLSVKILLGVIGEELQ